MIAAPRVLIAADSDEQRLQIATMLEREPWQIVGARESAGVLELARAQRADLVLIDAQISGVDGFEICRRMRLDSGLRLVPVVLISCFDDVASRVAALDAGADDFLSQPLESNEVIARVRSLLLIKSMRDRLEDIKDVILTLAKAAEAKDRFTVRHAERVARHACDLALRVGLAGDVIEQVRIGAVIHDVGKIAVPDQVLNKPGPLTVAEFELVKRHTIVGSEIVAPLASQPELASIVRSHHERFDGNGYPDGLAGRKIPFTARIVAISDAYDAMVNERPYRPAMTQSVALGNLLAGKDAQWDGDLVDAFVALMQ